MADLQGRKVFKVFNQDFIVDERYTVTKELGQGAYGIVWYGLLRWRKPLPDWKRTPMILRPCR
jgi:mitogen-activated protein kinase 7